MGSSLAKGMFVVVSFRLHRVHPSPLLLLLSLLSPLSNMPSIVSDVRLSLHSSFVFVLALVDSLHLDSGWLLGGPLSVDWTDDRNAQYN